ncbi:MAG: hypothetical protein EOM59_12860 [Clostridia bacterium]|nr:hypothetical protein [Clostridia bacterium]
MTIIKPYDIDKQGVPKNFLKNNGDDRQHLVSFSNMQQLPFDYNPAKDLKPGEVPHHYFHLPLIDDGYHKAQITIDKKPDNQFPHLIQQTVVHAKNLSHEQLWLAVARGVAYAMEGLWRGHKNQSNMFLEDELEFVTNPQMQGLLPNAVIVDDKNRAMGFNSTITQDDFDRGDFSYAVHFIDNKRYRWDKASKSTNFGMTVGQSEGFPHDPKVRINPRTMFGLYDSDVENTPIMKNALTHEALIDVLNKDGHVCRVMSPIGPVSSYVGKNANGEVFLSTFLESDYFIHSNAKVNEYALLALHSAAQFTAQAYAIGMMQGGNVSVGQLNPDFFMNIEGGVNFWNEAKSLTANTLNLGEDQVTRTARYVSEVVTHPFVKLQNQIAKEQYEQGMVVIQPSMMMDQLYEEAHFMAADEIPEELTHRAFPEEIEKNIPIEEESWRLGYRYMERYMAGQNYHGLEETLNAKKEYYKLLDEKSSPYFDFNLDVIGKIREGLPYEVATRGGPLPNDLFFIETLTTSYSIHMHTHAHLQYRNSNKFPLEVDGVVKMTTPGTELPDQLTIDLDAFERFKQQQARAYMSSSLKMFDEPSVIGATAEQELDRKVGG